MTEMILGNLEALMALATEPAKVEKVEVTYEDPTTGEEKSVVAYVKVMRKERDDFNEMILSFDKKGEVSVVQESYSAKLLLCTLCDAEGNTLLEPVKKNLEIIRNLPRPVLDKLFTAAQRINKMRKEDVESTIKNSEGTPT